MAAPVQGAASIGAVPQTAPIVLAGLNDDGEVTPLRTNTDGSLVFSTVPDAGAAGGDLTGTYPNPTIDVLKVTGAKIANATIALPKMIGTFPYLKVQTGVPTVLTSPIVYDNTAVTGGLYGWDGAAYVKIAGLAP